MQLEQRRILLNLYLTVLSGIRPVCYIFGWTQRPHSKIHFNCILTVCEAKGRESIQYMQYSWAEGREGGIPAPCERPENTLLAVQNSDIHSRVLVLVDGATDCGFVRKIVSIIAPCN